MNHVNREFEECEAWVRRQRDLSCLRNNYTAHRYIVNPLIDLQRSFYEAKVIPVQQFHQNEEKIRISERRHECKNNRGSDHLIFNQNQFKQRKPRPKSIELGQLKVDSYKNVVKSDMNLPRGCDQVPDGFRLAGIGLCFRGNITF